MAICTFVGFCYATAFMFKALGKVACWAIGGVAAIIGAVVVGSFAIVAVYFFAVLTLCVGALFA